MSEKYVKKIRRDRYANGKEIDTDVYNYGCVISKILPAERTLFNGILNTAAATGAALGTLWNFAAALQERPQPAALIERLLKKDRPSQIDLSDYLPGLHGLTVFDVDTLTALRTLTYLSRQPLKGGYRDHEAQAFFWECFYERVRSEDYPTAPSRAASFFLFSSLESAVAYERKHRTGASHDYLFCDVVATTPRTAFVADMTILDEVGFEQTYAAAAEEIRRYWRQERSETPLMEVLFQGTANLGERLRLSAMQS